tara:strand:+ start:110 stop:445 length:336 start_codon:yes stop_codon:yes gene_type:complete
MRDSNILFEDPRTKLNSYYYLHGDKLESVDGLVECEYDKVYFTTYTTPTTPTDIVFAFVSLELVNEVRQFKSIIESTDWSYYPYFLKVNVIDKLKELEADFDKYKDIKGGE